MNIVSVGLLFLLLGGGAVLASEEPCSSCHEIGHAQWTESLHGRSAEDPLYLGMRAWARSEAGDEMAGQCIHCHTVAVLGSDERTSAVTCEVCHQGWAEGDGPRGWRVDRAQAVLSAGPAIAAPHPIAVSAELASGAQCLVCHAELRNPRGVPLCTTGDEWQTGSADVSCLSCHMSEGDHGFPGTTAEMLGGAARLEVEIRGETASVMVVNHGAGHALPTGSPLRQIHLEVRFLDRAGEEVSQHREVFAKFLADAEGNFPVPPWRAVGVHRDSRLKPQERRQFALPVPAGADEVTARLVYYRAPAKIVEKLALADEPLMAPVEMVRWSRDLRND